MQDSVSTPTNRNKSTLNIDFRIVSALLIVVAAAMLFFWKPWHKAAATDRVITVTGEATITAAPDQYIFYPSYEFKNTDKAAALAELTAKSDEVVAKLKTLGVADSKIKTNASGNDYQYYYDMSTGKATYNLQLTITLTDKQLSQKVQDYLVTTTPLGSVSPQTSFSKTTQKKLESQARDEATKEARSKADQSAKNLGFKVGSVKSVDDGSGFSGSPCGINRICASAALDVSSSKETTTSLAVQPGENDLNYSVTVTYYIH